MARVMEPTPEQEEGYRAWASGRPANIRAVAERFEPWSLYRMKDTGQRVMVSSFGEQDDGVVTLTVMVLAKFNFTLFECEVFGVNPDNLEPCELPDSSELVGAMLPSEQVDEHIDEIRLMVRPDLWARDETGKAIRKH